MLNSVRIDRLKFAMAHSLAIHWCAKQKIRTKFSFLGLVHGEMEIVVKITWFIQGKSFFINFYINFPTLKFFRVCSAMPWIESVLDGKPKTSCHSEASSATTPANDLFMLWSISSFIFACLLFWVKPIILKKDSVSDLSLVSQASFHLLNFFLWDWTDIYWTILKLKGVGEAAHVFFSQRKGPPRRWRTAGSQMSCHVFVNKFINL